MLTTQHIELFTKMNNELRRPIQVHASIYEAPSFDIPSLAYAMKSGEPHRHFSADDSGFNDPEHLEWGLGSYTMRYSSIDDYESYDDLQDALHDMIVECHPNGHVAHAIPQFVGDELSQILLLIFWA